MLADVGTMSTNHSLNFSQVVARDRVPEQLNVSFHWHILATESKRWPRHAVQVEGKRWTISHGFAVTIKNAVTMANAALTT